MAQTAKVLMTRAVAFCLCIHLPLMPYESQPNSGLHKASKEFVFVTFQLYFGSQSVQLKLLRIAYWMQKFRRAISRRAVSVAI